MTKSESFPWRKTFFWGFILLGVFFFFYLVSGVLLPFVAAFMIAFLLNPGVSRLERIKVPRTLAGLVMLLAFYILVVLGLFLIIPFLKSELTILAQQIPSYGERFYQTLTPTLEEISAYLPSREWEKLKETASGQVGHMFSWVFQGIASLLTGTLALANLISLILLTPIIAFYLLRDWDRLTQTIDDFWPRKAAPTIRGLLTQVNETLSAYLRGQALVCGILAVYYAFALKILGLNYGVTIGLTSGLLVFIPYFGIFTAFIVALSLGLAQFSQWEPFLWMAAIYAVGAGVESYILTPKLVGERVGLHPVWIIFALLAGGVLFGFSGILLAMPAAAALGVVLRFAFERYRSSPYYKGLTSSAQVKQAR